MTKRLLGVDPLTGLKTYHEYDHQTRKTIITYEHDDAQPVLDWTHGLRSGGITDYNRKRDVWHAATVPETVILKWRFEDGIDIYNPDHFDAVRKKLNDPEWAYLRTWEGKI